MKNSYTNHTTSPTKFNCSWKLQLSWKTLSFYILNSFSKAHCKTILLLLLFDFSLSSLSFSQTAPAIQWQNTIGGNFNDGLSSALQTADGGYMLGGYSFSDISGDKTENSNGGADYWIVKTDATGNIQWQNTIGGSNEDRLLTIQQTTDGGYILGGYSLSNISGDKTENSNGGADYWIVKTDAIGNIQWQNTIGGSSTDELRSIQQTTDGGYILGGNSSSNISGDKTENSNGGPDYWIVKTDGAGTIQWQNTIGGNNLDYLYSLQQTTDGGYILGGYSNSNISGDKTENAWNSSFDYWIVKTDAMGNIQWQNTIGGTSIDRMYSIQQTADGGFILGGNSSSNISGDKTENNIGGTAFDDYWIIKTDAAGTIQWQNTIGGFGTDRMFSIQQTADGGYILGGNSSSGIGGDKTENSIGLDDYWIIKTDPTGNIQWQNTIGGSQTEYLSSIQQTADEGYILGGHSDSNISGDKTENTNGVGDYWIVKIAPDTATGIADLEFTIEDFKVYPNPFSDKIIIKTGFESGLNSLKLLDVFGREILFKPSQTISNKHQTTLEVSSLSPGIYFAEVRIEKGIITKKIIKQ